MKVTHEQKEQLQQKILSYYKNKGRDLPWRKTTNPYFILLSEIMLQQTQVERVIKYYERWTTLWPTIEDFGQASRTEVLKEWMGLGYNNRALNLHKTCQIIVEQFNSDVLKALHHYKDLPGIGPYTAASVPIFAANKDIVTVDTNIRRIFIHEFSLDEKITDKELWELAEKCLPKGKSRDWHNGLMDYGATLLTARKTGIKPKTKQSKFEGSDRQIRAKIVKYLVSNQSLSLSNISSIVGEVEKARLTKILQKMEKEGLVLVDQKTISLV